MQGAEEGRLRRMGGNTPQGGAIEGNAADDALLVDQAWDGSLTRSLQRDNNILLAQYL